LFHAWAKDGHHHLLERTEESFVVLAHIYTLPSTISNGFVS
jgi:hypothetical protein